MITKRSKVWTVIFAFLPGAGHMFNGFMRMGVSLMGLFFATWALASFINIGAIMFIIPVIWFYAFFDCINRCFLEDEDFYAQEDRYLFTLDQAMKLDLGILKKYNLLIGVILIILGIYALWQNVIFSMIWNYSLLPPRIISGIGNFGRMIPQIIAGILIIWAGIAMIRGKKREVETRVEEPFVKKQEEALPQVNMEAANEE